MDTKILIIALSTLIAALAWISRFAINEYPVFKRLKIPSKILQYGFPTVFTFCLWNISANRIYSAMMPFIQQDKIEEMKKTITYMADNNDAYSFTASWLFLWFCAICIDELAKSINKARSAENEKAENIKK